MAALKGGPSNGAGSSGFMGGQIGDANSMLSGLGMSALVGQDQAGMRNAGLAAGLGSIGQGLMQGGTQGGLFDSTGLPSAADASQAAMLRYGMDPTRQSRSQEAIAQIPPMLLAPGIGQGGGMSGGMGGGMSGGMGGAGFAGAGMAGRPGGGGNILDFLRMTGGGF